MWQEVLQASASGGGSDISVQTFEFDNTVNTATSKPFNFEYEGTALGIFINGEAYTAAGARASSYDNALSWYKGIPERGLVRYGNTYGASTVPTTTTGYNPTIQTWNGNTVTFRTSNNSNYARCKFTVTVYSEE